MAKKIIFDIGAHDGTDTAFFLQTADTVIAVEANPVLIEALQNRFAPELQSGAVELLHVAIGDSDELSQPFYISADDGKSSLLKDIASREDGSFAVVDVKTITLSSLIKRYGAPHYCKIDIEGYDVVAIRSLASSNQVPLYISCETSCQSIQQVRKNRELLFETLNALHDAGYKRFQLIDQHSLAMLNGQKHYTLLHTLAGRIVTRLERLTGLYSQKYNNRLYQARKRKISDLSLSSPFGDMLPANDWKDYATARKLLEDYFDEYYAVTENKDFIFWVDIHAGIS